MAIRSADKFIEVRVTGFLARRRSPEILRAIEDGMLRAASGMIPFVQQFTPVYTGNLMNSYQVQMLQGPRRAVVTSPLSYVGVMELGRRPGRRQPPPGPIRNWVIAKINPPPKKVSSVTYLVARKIGRLGIQVPLKFGGLGRMFARAVELVGGALFGEEVVEELRRLR